jgi:hypothetical protein
MAVGVELIDHHGAMLSAVTSQIALAVAINIETTNQAVSHRLFPNGCVDGCSAPGNIAGETNVH